MKHENEAVSWNPVCTVEDILPNTGVCALIKSRHVAIFHVKAENDRFFAIDNFDPNSSASVLSRGLVGNVGERIVVASPIYKHHFDLQTGQCLEAPEHSINAYPVQVENGKVLVAV